MNEKNKNIDSGALLEIADQLLKATPDVVKVFVAENNDEQQDTFLKGSIDVPVHHYRRLADFDVNSSSELLAGLHQQLLAHPDTSPKYIDAYKESLDYNLKQLRLIQVAQELHATSDSDRKTELQKEFMQLNIELYGEPDKHVFLTLVQEDRDTFGTMNLSGKAAGIRDELPSLLPESNPKEQRFIPQGETVKWVGEVTRILYGGMLCHVEDREEPYTPTEVREILETIVREEFDEAAKDWHVILDDVPSIGVRRKERVIVIPRNREPITSEDLRGLVVHELGVHMLRIIMGSETDMPFMAAGLPRYHVVEEGLGKVMEQALKGTYEDSGVPYYLIASLMYFEGKSFREVHEVMWRRSVLLSLKDEEELTDDVIAASKGKAYRSIRRITRGTDTLPWFKDLAYYNGSELAWKYMEASIGDDLAVTMALMGKTDLSNPSHTRVLLETKTP